MPVTNLREVGVEIKFTRVGHDSTRIINIKSGVSTVRNVGTVRKRSK
jgi:hypothetical protein